MADWNEQSGENPVAISAKRCPQCSKVVGLHVSECPDCGHLFRTRFQESINRTQAFDAVLLPRANRPAPGPSAGPASGSSAGPSAGPLPPRSRRSYSRRVRRVRFSPLSAISTFGLAFLGSFSLVALLGVGAWTVLGLNRTEPPPPSAKRAALTSKSGGLRTGDARDLYGQIMLSMSLYDLQQVAGGMGRVIRSSNPHTLILSYDYPEQSVRVSLYRIDPVSDDYRVQAVALYHGRHLLNHTTGD